MTGCVKTKAALSKNEKTELAVTFQCLAASMMMQSDDPKRKRISMSNIAQPTINHNNYCCNKGTFQVFGHFNP